MPISNFRPTDTLKLKNMIGLASPAFGNNLLCSSIASAETAIFMGGATTSLILDKNNNFTYKDVAIKSGNVNAITLAGNGNLVANVQGSGGSAGLMYSNDFGESWIASTVSNTSSVSSELAANNNAVVWYRENSSPDQVFTSTDNGQSFNSVGGGGLGNGPLIHSRKFNVFLRLGFTGTGAFFNRSTDGITWILPGVALSQNVPGGDATFMFERENTDLLVALAGSGSAGTNGPTLAIINAFEEDGMAEIGTYPASFADIDPSAQSEFFIISMAELNRTLYVQTRTGIFRESSPESYDFEPIPTASIGKTDSQQTTNAMIAFNGAIYAPYNDEIWRTLQD